MFACIFPFYVTETLDKGTTFKFQGFFSNTRLFSNTTHTEASFLDLHLSIADGFVSFKIYDKRDDFDFDIVNFPF